MSSERAWRTHLSDDPRLDDGAAGAVLSSRDAARLAARPRPNVLPRFMRPRENPPAFCAACSACARNGFVRGERVERIRPGRMRKSSLPAHVRLRRVSKAERPIARCQKSQVARDAAQGLRDRWNSGAAPQPNRPPHLARFILPSSVARSQRPSSKPELPKDSQPLARKCKCSHCG